uniref:Uncharacterized protein n=1 Tax=Rhizophora mucronata TaxID=61149 RepID=A0A2P2IST3_RHIMU
MVVPSKNWETWSHCLRDGRKIQVPSTAVKMWSSYFLQLGIASQSLGPLHLKSREEMLPITWFKSGVIC